MGIQGQFFMTSETGPEFPVESLLVEDIGGLDIRFNPGAIRLDTDSIVIASGTITMTDDTTNYVFVNSSGTMTSNTTGFPTDSILVAEVVTASGDISGVTDKRTFSAVDDFKGQSYCFAAGGNNFVYSTDTVYANMARFIFRGTSVLGTPSTVKFLARIESPITTADIRIFDQTNSLVIAEITTTNTGDFLIEVDSTLLNLPAGEAVFAVQGRQTGGGGGDGVLLASLEIF